MGIGVIVGAASTFIGILVTIAIAILSGIRKEVRDSKQDFKDDLHKMETDWRRETSRLESYLNRVDDCNSKLCGRVIVLEQK